MPAMAAKQTAGSSNPPVEPRLFDLIKDPIGTADAALRTGFAIVNLTAEALRAIPRLAAALEKLTPAVQAAQSSLDRIDRMGNFVAQELPETQHQLEQLRAQLSATAAKVSELGPQLVSSTGVNRALNESIRMLSRGLGVVQGTSELLSGILDRLPDVGPTRPSEVGPLGPAAKAR